MSDGKTALILGLLCLLFVGLFAFSYGWRPSFMGLTRGTAADKIAASLDFQSSKSALIHVGTFGRYDATPGMESEYATFEKAGFITATKDRMGWHVQVTPAGEKAFQSVNGNLDADNNWFVPLATREMVSVTGISTNENIAQADFAWKWKMNSLGLLFATGDYSAELAAEPGKLVIYSGDESNTAIFKKWDDGWRLERLNLKQ